MLLGEIIKIVSNKVWLSCTLLYVVHVYVYNIYLILNNGVLVNF